MTASASPLVVDSTSLKFRSAGLPDTRARIPCFRLSFFARPVLSAIVVGFGV
jgi:hypothetical protein